MRFNLGVNVSVSLVVLDLEQVVNVQWAAVEQGKRHPEGRCSNVHITRDLIFPGVPYMLLGCETACLHLGLFYSIVDPRGFLHYGNNH